MSSPSPARPGQDRAALVGKGGTKYSPAVTDTLTFSPASPGPKGRRGDAKITPDPGMGPQSPGAVAVVVSKGEPKSPATDDMDDDGAGGKRSAAVNPNISARRVRLQRQKTCRNIFMILWLILLTAACGVLLFTLLSQESNTDLLVRIKALEKVVKDNDLTITATAARIDDSLTFDSTRLNQFINLVTGQVLYLDEHVGNLSTAVNLTVTSTSFLLTNVSRVNTVLNTHTALLTNHGQRINMLEGVSSDVIVSTQLLASTANETTGRTYRIQAEVNDLYARVIPLRSDMNYGIANISNLNTVSASHTASITNLQGRMATAEGTLATAVSNLSITMDTTATTTSRSLSNTARVVALETTGDQSVLSLNATRASLLPTRRHKSLESHTGTVNAVVAIRPDGWVASVSSDKSVKVWDTHTGLLVGTLVGTPSGNDHLDKVFALASLARAQLCSGGADSKVIVWDITTPSLPVKVTEWLAHFGTVYALSALAENETGLVSGGTDTLVKVWDVTGSTTTRLVASLGATYNTNQSLGHTDVVISVISVAAGVVVSGARDDVAIVWQRATGAATYTIARQLTSAGSGDVTALAVLPSNRQQVSNALVAAGCADGRVRIWEWATGVLKATIAAHPSNPIFGLTVLRDAVLVTGSADGTFAMWETYQYTQLWGPIRNGNATISTVTCLTTLVDGTLVSGSTDTKLSVWRSGYAQPAAAA